MSQAEARQDDNSTEEVDEQSEGFRWHQEPDMVQKLSEIRRRKKSRFSDLLAAFKKSVQSQDED